MDAILSISQSLGKCLSASLALSRMVLGTRGVHPGSHSSSNSFLPCFRARYRSSGNVMIVSDIVGAFAPTIHYADLFCLFRIIARISFVLSVAAVVGFSVTTGSDGAGVALAAGAALSTPSVDPALAGASIPYGR